MKQTDAAVTEGDEFGARPITGHLITEVKLPDWIPHGSIAAGEAVARPSGRDYRFPHIRNDYLNGSKKEQE